MFLFGSIIRILPIRLNNMILFVYSRPIRTRGVISWSPSPDARKLRFALAESQRLVMGIR